MNLGCPGCSHHLTASDLDPDMESARCHRCGMRVPVTVTLRGPGTSPDRMSPEMAPVIPRVPEPQGLSLERTGKVMDLCYSWRDATLWTMVPFCIAWNSFLVFWYGAAFHMPGRGSEKVLMIVFPVCHVAVGVGLLWTVLALVFNRTRVSIEGEHLDVVSGPIPPWNRVCVPCRDIDLVFVRATPGQSEDSPRTYDLLALDRAGTQTLLIEGSRSLDRVRFVEQSIIDHLQLPVRPVAGQITG